MVNLYNFMDGIDGIAGVEATMAGAVGAMLSWYTGLPSIAVCAAVVAAGAAGFLVWNRPPAKIFMGDVGSGVLGFFFAVIALASETRGGPPLIVWAGLLGVFIVDATATLVRRVLHGEKWYSAHRSHAYQRAVQAGWSHARVTGAVMLINVLLALAAVVAGALPSTLPWIGGVMIAFLGAVYLRVERIRPMRVT